MVHRIEERISEPFPEVTRIFIEVEALAGAVGEASPAAGHTFRLSRRPFRPIPGVRRSRGAGTWS